MVVYENDKDIVSYIANPPIRMSIPQFDRNVVQFKEQTESPKEPKKPVTKTRSSKAKRLGIFLFYILIIYFLIQKVL